MHKVKNDIDIKAVLAAKSGVVERALKGVLVNRNDLDGRIKEAMEYSLLAGGKRLRGGLVLLCCEIVGGGVNEAAMAGAAAVEMVHTYSLVHDDLPAMDDDDMRRGVASCHKKFDEATAILAGDGLLTMAFEVLAYGALPGEKAVAMIKELADAAGPCGMIAGQMADIEGENTEATIEKLEYIHKNKTAKMFGAAATLGAIAGGGTNQQVSTLGEFGFKLGLAFQVADDILDVSATSAELGKTAGKDAAQGKMTYPSLLGIGKAKEIEQKISTEAVESLEIFGDKADVLRGLMGMLLKRTK